MKYGTIIPLIGGSAIGCSQSTDKKPSFHLSYQAFKNNESHLEEYWPDVPMYRLDDENLSIPDDLYTNVDYINSVCPCAGLSQLNTSKGGELSRGSDAIQNEWMYKSSEYVLERIKPKVLWGENAPGLFTGLGEGVVTKLKEIANRYGYTFSIYKTNSMLHGLPQRRIRTFYFFWKSPVVPIISWKKTEMKNLADYLNEIPKEATYQDWYPTEGKVSDHYKPYKFVLEYENLTHKEFSKKIKKSSIDKYLDKNNLKDKCIQWLEKNYPDAGYSNKKNVNTFIDLLKYQQYKVSIGKGYWDRSPHFYIDYVSAIINRNMYNTVHPTEDRYLNVREMMHLMGLPHDFQFKTKNSLNHIAQNVPVNTAKDMADEVKSFCEGNAKLTNYSFMKQDNTKQDIVYYEHKDTKLNKNYKTKEII